MRTNTNFMNSGGAHTADSVQGDGSVLNPIQLVNDNATPGANMVYSTNPLGTKGWHFISSLVLPSLNDGLFWIGDSLNTAVPRSMSQDATMDDVGKLTISNGAVTYAKMQNMSSTKLLLGSSSVTSAIQEITLGTGLTIVGTTLTLGSISPGAINLTNSHIFVGNSGNVAADVAMTGVIAITDTGVTSLSPLSFASLDLYNALTTKTGSTRTVFSSGPTFDTTITIGTAGGSTPGTAIFIGNTSGGAVTVQANQNTASSTITLPANGANPHDVLTSNGGTSGQTVWSSPLRGHVASVFENISVGGRFLTTLISGGTVAVSGGGAQLDVNGAILGSSFVQLQLSTGNVNYHIFAKSPQLATSFFFKTIGTTGSVFGGTGNVTTAGVGHTFTNTHIGFKVLIVAGVATLYATQADGATENATLLTTIAPSDILDVYYVTNTTSVDYYWSKNGGVTSGTVNLTSNMPATSTSDNIVWQGSMSTDGTTSVHEVTFQSFDYSRLIN